MDIVLLIAVAAIPLWLNVRATFLVYRDTFSERRQKIAQLLFVWLVPVVGAIVILGVHRKSEKSPGTYPAEKNPGDEFAGSGRAVRTIGEAIDGD
jgi:hypothetical protein